MHEVDADDDHGDEDDITGTWFPSDSLLVKTCICSPNLTLSIAVVLTKILSQPLHQKVLFSPYCH